MAIKTGTPQGGILSVILWNLSFDILLQRLKGKKVKVIGFADDGALLIHGLKLEYMAKLLQKSINIASNWARESGLKLSPEKNGCNALYQEKENSHNPETVP